MLLTITARPRLLRAGELIAVWVPDEGREAMRDLVRARAAAGSGRTVLATSAAVPASQPCEALKMLCATSTQ